MTASDVLLVSAALAVLVAAFVAFFKDTIAKIPKKLWEWGVQRCTYSFRIANNERGFDFLTAWLRQHSSQRSRAVKVTYSLDDNRFKILPGHGLHWLWHKGPLWIRYGSQEKKSEWGGVRNEESYTVTLFGFRRKRLEDFITLLDGYCKPNNDRLDVYTWQQSYWHWVGPKRKRPLSTVYMPAKTRQLLLKTIDEFLASEERYAVRGIPWRLGLSFEGETGTGKTTAACALAGHYNRPIYLINLKTLGSDETALRAFLSVPRDGVALIEDIDTFDTTRKREGVENPDADDDEETPEIVEAEVENEDGTKEKVVGTATPNGQPKKKVEAGVTLSGLLNAIDGVAATEGRILIITTNNASKLDPALLREGRIRERIYIGPLEPTDVEHMYTVFYRDEHTAATQEQVRLYATKRRHTAAWWQKLFLDYEDHKRLIEDVILPDLGIPKEGRL